MIAPPPGTSGLHSKMFQDGSRGAVTYCAQRQRRIQYGGAKKKQWLEEQKEPLNGRKADASVPGFRFPAGLAAQTLPGGSGAE